MLGNLVVPKLLWIGINPDVGMLDDALLHMLNGISGIWDSREFAYPLQLLIKEAAVATYSLNAKILDGENIDDCDIFDLQEPKEKFELLKFWRKDPWVFSNAELMLNDSTERFWLSFSKFLSSVWDWKVNTKTKIWISDITIIN